MPYRKQISYLELQENGQRIKTAGFARLESLEKEDVLTVLLNGQDILSGKEVTLYLQRESGDQPLGEMKSDRGEVSGEIRIPGKKEREPILGVRIPLEENIEIIGQFVKGGVAKKASTPETDRQPWEQTKKAAETVVANGETVYRECRSSVNFEIAEILKSPTVLFHRRRLESQKDP